MYSRPLFVLAIKASTAASTDVLAHCFVLFEFEQTFFSSKMFSGSNDLFKAFENLSSCLLSAAQSLKLTSKKFVSYFAFFRLYLMNLILLLVF